MPSWPASANCRRCSSRRELLRDREHGRRANHTHAKQRLAGTVGYAPGKTSQKFTVTVQDDTTAEAHETTCNVGNVGVVRTRIGSYVRAGERCDVPFAKITSWRKPFR
jgi:hypothetical protein